MESLKPHTNLTHSPPESIKHRFRLQFGFPIWIDVSLCRRILWCLLGSWGLHGCQMMVGFHFKPPGKHKVPFAEELGTQLFFSSRVRSPRRIKGSELMWRTVSFRFDMVPSHNHPSGFTDHTSASPDGPSSNAVGTCTLGSTEQCFPRGSSFGSRSTV